MKDIEWLKEEIWKQDIVMDKGYIYTDDLMSIINEVVEPEFLSQELPVIPKFVADAIKGSNHMYVAGFLDAINKENEELKQVREWVDSKYGAKWNLLARAWLDGFTVEEEQKYNVKFKVKSSSGTVGIFLYKEGDEVLAGDNFKAYYPKEDKCRLTEQEIRDFQNGDILFEHFAVKVEELEE